MMNLDVPFHAIYFSGQVDSGCSSNTGRSINCSLLPHPHNISRRRRTKYCNRNRINSSKMASHTRSVRFAPKNQLIVIRNDDMIDSERKWFSQEEEEEFRRKMAKDVKRLRAAIVSPHPPQDELIDCNGIEVHILFSEDIRQRLRDMKRVHRQFALHAQHLFTPLEFSQVLQRGSEYARQHALKLAALKEYSTMMY